MHILRYIVYFVFIITIVAFSSCEEAATDPSDATNEFCIPDSLMKNITLDTVKAESVNSALNLTGKITFNENNVVKVFPFMGGHVVDVKVSLGDYVEKGQLLAIIRSSDMAGYYSDYKAAQSELAIAKKNYEVTADMKNSGVSSEKDYLTAQSEYQKALAQFNKINELLKIYGTNGAQPNDSIGSGYPIKAPINGFIVEKNINTGMELRPDAGSNLFTISDLKEVWAVANVYETDIDKIKEGDSAEIATLSYPDKKFTGTVDRVSNILNPETNVMNIKIKLSNADYSLKPGMMANIAILFPGKDKMMAVPGGTILFDDNKSYVVRFNKRCDVDMEQVSIIKSFNNTYYIQSDSLHEHDLVVGRNNLFIFTALKKL